MTEEIGFFEAYETVLTPLFTASNTLRLVAGAQAVGLIEALRDRSSTAHLCAHVRGTHFPPFAVNSTKPSGWVQSAVPCERYRSVGTFRALP